MMKTDLDHLPPQKQREIERVLQLIFEEFEDAFALAKQRPSGHMTFSP